MDHRLSTRVLLGITIVSMLGGCGNRYFSSRATNPLIEDRVRMGASGAKKMSVLTSRADRRTILVFGEGQICAEPSPDVAEAVYSQATAELATKGINVAAGSTLQTALLQLTRRSQGLDFYRTGAFVNCMMHYNGALSAPEYKSAMTSLLQQAVQLTTAEMDNLPEIMKTVAQVEKPQATTINVNPPAATTNTTPAGDNPQATTVNVNPATATAGATKPTGSQ